ncbi:RHS repeat-associated core domain-containing protein [Archangium minus]|uniref:RHS repeat-associated core domain-containing protein n=1 Tax=Archangium minus TaxID=83450 RepID=A0ABY9WNY3_9BACT|nr:RHS repeat-associated core domain-containing protein [Archangium minus]
MAQVAEPPESDIAVQSAIEKATYVPIPELGGPRAAGVEGEVTLGGLRSFYSHTDFTAQSVMGPVSFVRYYGMDTQGHTTSGLNQGFNQRPRWAPFGSMKADPEADLRNGIVSEHCGQGAETKYDCRGGLRWWHNFDSWVEPKSKKRPCNDTPQYCQNNPEYDVTWVVHAPDGRTYAFDSCSLLGEDNEMKAECYGRNHEDSDVKLALKYGGSSSGDGFVLITPTARYVYTEPMVRSPDGSNEPPYPGMVSFRLSYILAPERGFLSCGELGEDTPCQRRLATLHYGQVCMADKATVLNPTALYVTHIEIAGAGTLALLYDSVYLRDRKQLINVLADGGTDGKYIPPKECVLSRIVLTPPEGDATPPREVVKYAYPQGPFEDDTGTTTQKLGGLLSQVTLSAGGLADGSASLETRLSYEYGEAVLPKEGGPSLQPLRTFRVLRNGVFEREYVLDAADGAYVKQTQVGDTQVHLWADNNGLPRTKPGVPDAGLSYCHPGNFGTNKLDSEYVEINCKHEQTQYQQTEATLVGDGSGSLVPGPTQKFHMDSKPWSSHGPLLTDMDWECAGAACSALAPQQRSRSWDVTWYNLCPYPHCPPRTFDFDAYAPKTVRDTRGNLLVLESRLADGGVMMSNSLPANLPPVEVHAMRAGATQEDGSDALQTRLFSYTYGFRAKQQVKDEWGDSALVPSGSYQVRRHYEPGTSRLIGVVRSGYTLQFDEGGQGWTPVLRHVGTFYKMKYSCTVEADGGLARAGAGEDWGRVVEVVGPCQVDGPDATQCAWNASQVPITQYEYWPATEADPLHAGRLARRRVFSRTSAHGTCDTPGLPVDPSSYVETRYERYDVQGRLTQWQDANGVVTKYTYSGDKLVEARVADGTPMVAVTKYGYDNGQGTGNWVLNPDGRYEVQCFRQGTTLGAGCTGGVLTDKLQWKATSRGPEGAHYSERVDYTYAANGQLVGETVRDGTGAVRRQRYFEGDPLGRTTYEATGSSAPSPASDSRYHQVSLFDMEGNRVGLGTAYQPTSSPLEPLCGGFAPHSSEAHAVPASPLCKAFEYDRLNRLSRLMEPLDTQGGQKAVTCLGYDTQGNLASVSRAGTSRPCEPSAQHSVRYVHDDFGNLVRVVAPWARGPGGGAGEYQYGYDSAGNLTLKQTPTMAQTTPATWVRYSYDAMGRLLKAQAARADAPQALQTLYSYGYDGQVPPPLFCPGGEGDSGGSPHLKGRAQVLTDSFGDTWYAYDVHGRPTAHLRVRAQPGQPERTVACNPAHGPLTPNRRFYFDQAGRMINEVLPGGRALTYLHHSAWSSMPHRVSEVRASTWDGSRWTGIVTLLKDVQWEPYGGLKSYALQAHLSTNTGTTSWRYVDYLRTASATTPLSRCSDTGIVSGSDYTGRLKAVTVSTEAERAAGRYGDIYKRVYTWKADQVVREDTCVLDTRDVAPETLAYAGSQGEAGFDTRGQLRHVTGRPHELRTYTYDDLGNRRSERRGSFVFQLGYAPEAGGLREDALRTRSTHACGAGTACATTTPLTSPTEHFTYDDDGRLGRKEWTGQSVGMGNLGHLEFGTALDAPNAALGAVYRSVTDDAARTWEYFYDAQGRRRLKLHPSGAAEESFYDDTLLLEDWSVTSLVNAEADSVRDEYIWLDGRPVALFKTRVSHAGARVADFTGTCERYSDDVPPACGVYFPITDVLGKPVVMLDGAGRVTGVADYDAFGHVNRVSHPAESRHPSVLDGRGMVLATTTAIPAARTGINVHVRAHFSVLRGGVGSKAYLINEFGARLPAALGTTTDTAGDKGLLVPTPWVNAASATQVRVQYVEANDPNTEPEGAPWGASLEGFEYRRFQVGATPVWTPLRLPGQYHDFETDLFENWNRYYDPSIGRYLGPDRAMLEPDVLMGELAAGQSVHAYAYARNNPIINTDPMGLLTEEEKKKQAELDELALQAKAQLEADRKGDKKLDRDKEAHVPIKRELSAENKQVRTVQKTTQDGCSDRGCPAGGALVDADVHDHYPKGGPEAGLPSRKDLSAAEVLKINIYVLTHSRDNSRTSEFYKITPDRNIYKYDPKDNKFRTTTIQWDKLK